MTWKNIDIVTKNKHMQLIIRNANSYKSDLVEMSTVHGCCGECAKYQGRIYSLSGQDPRFPLLPDIVIQTGRLHKDCSHVLYNYIEGDRPFYLEGDIFEVSNRPFVDDRSDKEKHDRYRDVEGVTVELMSSLPNMPFNLSKPLNYNNRYPYIKMDSENLDRAEQHIEELLEAIRRWNPNAHGITHDLTISMDGAKNSRIVCTPYTNKLRIAHVPISLQFETNKVSPIHSEVGEISYRSSDGAICRAWICFWRNHEHIKFSFALSEQTIVVSNASINDISL